MKKQSTTAIAIALIALASSSFAFAGSLDFNSLADADILAGDLVLDATTGIAAVDFDAIADADLLAGADSWATTSPQATVVVEFNKIADADILPTVVCTAGAGWTE